VHPVGVLGSTFVRMFDVETVKMSGGDGYLKDLEDPLGCKNVSFTSEFSLSMPSTNASHHWPL